MKKIIPIVLLFALLMGCSKKDDVIPAETKSGVSLKFVKTSKLSTGETVENPYKMYIVMVWKSDGKDFVYNRVSDGEYAYDGVSKKSYKADYSYLNVTSETYVLPVGKYFITVVTNSDDIPRIAYSYTNFTVKTSEFVTVKKDVSTMKSISYSAW